LIQHGFATYPDRGRWQAFCLGSTYTSVPSFTPQLIAPISEWLEQNNPDAIGSDRHRANSGPCEAFEPVLGPLGRF
jgi:hypothetical protein